MPQRLIQLAKQIQQRGGVRTIAPTPPTRPNMLRSTPPRPTPPRPTTPTPRPAPPHVRISGPTILPSPRPVSSPSPGLLERSTRLTPLQIAQVAYDAGFRGNALVTIVAVALAESGGNPMARNPSGELSIGLTQININPNTSWGRARAQRYGGERGLMDPLTNLRAAYDISNRGTNFRPWTVFSGLGPAGRTGRQRFNNALPRARSAASQLSGFLSQGQRVNVATPGTSAARTPHSSLAMFVPVAGVTLNSIRDNYGAARSGGRSHKGLDIFARTGTPVLAAVGGRVVRASNDGGAGGLRIWIEGHDGRAYYYAHLHRIEVQVGQQVTPGQRIGQVGNTGNARNTPPHLHFSINRRVGPENPVGNPFTILRQARAGTVSPQDVPRPGMSPRGFPNDIPPGGVLSQEAQDTFTDPFEEAIRRNLSQQELEDFIRENYGHLAWALDHPEIGPILRRAAREMWSPARLQGAIFATNWWKKTSEAERTWMAIEAQDPAEASRQIERRVAEITQRLRRLGIPVHSRELRQMARDSLRFAWDESELSSAISAYALRRGREAIVQAGGDVAAFMSQIQGMSDNDFFTPMTSRTAFDHARRWIEGTASTDTVRQSLLQTALSRFPNFADRIRSGETPRQIFDPYIALAADTLEMDPESINVMRDTRFSPMTEFVASDGTRRPMTLAEWQHHLRRLPDYRFTSRANEEAARMAIQLTSAFGRGVL